MKTDYTYIKAVVFDADDTLWSNEPLFRAAEQEFYDTLADFGERDWLASELFRTEMSNMTELGYGAKAFIISMVETAVRISGGKVDAARIQKLVDAGRSIMRNPSTPLPGVVETLTKLRESGRYKMVLLTKGELLGQELKIDRSGLRPYFDLVDIVSEKVPEVYSDLCNRLGVTTSELLMVGNSFKSDIDPVLRIGGMGIYIPAEQTWQHEIVDEYEHPSLLRADDIRTVAEVLL